MLPAFRRVRPPPGGALTATRPDACRARASSGELGIGNATVATIWRTWDLQPWRVETFTFSTDPELDAKVRDVVGLYMNPPTKAVVVCVDAKTQIQALDRTAPILPLRPGVPEKQTHDDKRNGTTTLFAALEVATGTVTDPGPRHIGDMYELSYMCFLRRFVHILVVDQPVGQGRTLDHLVAAACR